jgi:RNase H-like domain found in reverse transcriptase/Reverse transcriptase (RNA-dependent DNA polymerase)/Integrase zinc binding domain
MIGGSGDTELMIDSGADANVICDRDFQLIMKEFSTGTRSLHDVDHSPVATISGYASESCLRITCSFKAWIEMVQQADEIPKKPKTFAEFFVVKGGGRSLLGRATAFTMRILQVGTQVNAISASPTADEEFPSIPGVEIDFDIDESVKGVHRSYVSIPAHFYEPAMKRIAEMCRTKIIEEVKTPGKWLSGLSAVPKGKGDMRLVVNMTGPNKAITRQVHPMPRFEEIQLKLYGAILFSKLDVSSAFFHLKLSKRSMDMTCFKAPSTTGTKIYRFCRLVFGVNCAPEIFQREMERILEGIPRIVIYIDDVLIAARDAAELESITALVLARLAANNLTLNKDKCEFGKESVTFLGHKISSKGFNIDEQKVQDVECFRSPQNSLELKSFLGLVNFVRGFVRSFSDRTKALRDVDKSGRFYWGKVEQEAFTDLKRTIIESTISQGFFSTNDRTELYTDASPYAIGAVLIQINDKGEQRVISFASKSLTETEKNYPHVQREALAIVWAVEHFHYYTLGARFTIKTDAQGVSFIFDKDNTKPKKFLRRAEGWALRLNTFNYDIEFVEGELNIADPSSRLFQSGLEPVEFDEGEMPCEIATIEINATDDIIYEDGHMPMEEVRMETSKCNELQSVIRAIETNKWPPSLQLYKAAREELKIVKGVMAKRGLIVLPVSLRCKAIDIAHEGHQGVTKTKSKLKDIMWWPRMHRAVEDWVAGCRMCILTGRTEETIPMQRTLLPQGPWDYVALDYCGPFAAFGDIHVVCIVDYHSRYAVAAIVKSTGWQYLEPVFQEVFGRLGLPGKMKADNGPPFSGNAYKQFCTMNDIERVSSFPLNPQQNGMAEAAMKHINMAAQHASVEGTSLGKTLAARMRAHNDSEHSETHEVPSQVMFGRRLRRGLPSLLPTIVKIDMEAMRRRDTEAKMSKKEREDSRRRARNTKIEVGDKVVLLRPNKRKGETRFGHEEWTVKTMRRGDLTLIMPDGTETRRDVTKVKRLPSSLQPTQPVNQDMEVDRDRPPSPFLMAGNWSPTDRSIEQTRAEPELLSPQREENDDRPPSPFLSSALWAPISIPCDTGTVETESSPTQAPAVIQPASPQNRRPKRNVQQPARLKDCVLNEVSVMDAV